uniref:cation transporting ATPase C-terminal domain-containing protein n=1 Tax=Rhodoblastus sp. TaxID=1962975 RepID=UPI003F96B71A
MLVFGPVSSIFDFITFWAMLSLFHAGQGLFQTGWFVESMVTQTLVVFCIRTRRLFFRSKPGEFLTLMNIGTVALAIALPFLPYCGAWFGFVTLPPYYFVFLAVATVAYLGLVELTKYVFYHCLAGPYSQATK